MLPYHPNSESLLPTPALPLLPAEAAFPLPLSDDDLVFALAAFALFFFSATESLCSSLDFRRLGFAWAGELDAFANTILLGAGFSVGLVFSAEVVVFRTGVAIGIGFGVGNSISLCA